MAEKKEEGFIVVESPVQPSKREAPLVGVIMGSQSDWETMKGATTILEKLEIPYEARIISAHRTPQRMFQYASTARDRGLKVIIAGAGGAAHLPGMTASLTSLPVLGVPVQSRALSGMDSLLSIVQMPGGIPVGTFAIGNSGATNAAIFAASVLSASGNYPKIAKALDEFRQKQTASVAEIPTDGPSPASHGTAPSSAPLIAPPSAPPVQQILQQVSAPKISEDKVIPPKIFEEKLIPPGSTIGIVGGGQLAKMIIVAAAQLGYRTHVYCPDELSPAFHIATEKTIADYLDKKSLQIFAERVDVVTYEFENIPAGTIEHISKFAIVRPKMEVLAVSQNRIKEKSFCNSVGIGTTNFLEVKSPEDVEAAIQKIGYPAVLKSATLGYDGKGQIILKGPESLKNCWKVIEEVKSEYGILEAFVDFKMEASVIVARGFREGKNEHPVTTFPVAENQHENHILKKTIVPANVSDAVAKEAYAVARTLAEKIDLVGLIAIELFITKDDHVLVNEIAPRPHNSGHWSIEGAHTSQFEQLIRAICGLPLGRTDLRAPKVEMINLLGAEIHEWHKYLEMPNAHLHNYGKKEAKPGRKMGHVTTLHERNMNENI